MPSEAATSSPVLPPVFTPDIVESPSIVNVLLESLTSIVKVLSADVIVEVD